MVDVETEEDLYVGHGTKEEIKAWIESSGADKDGFTYEGKAAYYAIDGTPCFARAEKAGNLTITIPKYWLSPGNSNFPVKVTIPVVIEADNTEDENTSDEEITSKDTIISDTDSTITLKDSNNVLPEGTTLTSEKLTEGTAFDDVKKLVEEEKAIGEYAVYELNLLDNTDAAIHQLDGKVKVTLDLPITVGEGNKLQVYWVDGNLLIECPTTVSEGKVTFETDHFSTYVIAEIEAATIGQKGDRNISGGYVLFLAGGVLVVCGVLNRKRILR